MKIEKAKHITKENVNIEGAKDVKIQWLISKKDGAQNFYMRMFELKQGGNTPLHSHLHEHEVFIIEGAGVFICDGKDYDFESEDVIFVPPNKQHQFKNTSDTLLRFLCLIPTSAV